MAIMAAVYVRGISVSDEGIFWKVRVTLHISTLVYPPLPHTIIKKPQPSFTVTLVLLLSS